MHCYRDADVLIYGVFFPLLIYPITLLVFADIALLCSTPRKTVVAINESKDNPTFAEFKRNLSQSKNLEFTKIDGGIQTAIAASRVDAEIRPSTDGKSIDVEFKSLDVERRLRDEISTAQTNARADALKRLGLTEKNLEVFSVKERNLDKKADSKVGFSAFAIIVVASLYAYFSIGVMIPPSLVLSEEFERKTLLMTLLIPASRGKLIVGKFISVFIVACSTVIAHMIGSGLILMLLVMVAIMTALIIPLSRGENLLYTLASGVIPVTLGAMAVLCALLLVTSTNFLTATFARTIKTAQIILPAVMLIMLFLPFISAVPSIELDYANCWIPLLNLGLVVKGLVVERLPPVPCAIAMFECLLLVVTQLWLVTCIYDREEYLFGNYTTLFRKLLFSKRKRS